VNSLNPPAFTSFAKKLSDPIPKGAKLYLGIGTDLNYSGSSLIDACYSSEDMPSSCDSIFSELSKALLTD
jgi:hypothetical protein